MVEAGAPLAPRLRPLIAALEGAAAAALITGADGAIIWVNEAFLGLSGYDRAEAIGRDFRFFHSDRQSEATNREIEHMISSGGAWSGELWSRRKDGAEIAEVMTIAPLADDHGEVGSFLAVKLDVTERRRAEEHLALLAHALNSIGEGVCMTGEDDVIRFVNEAFCSLYGYTREELIGRPIGLLRPPDFPSDAGSEISHGTAGQGWRGVVRNVRKDGSEITVALSTSTVRDPNGNALALIGVIRDVGEERRAAIELRESAVKYRALFEGANDGVLLMDGDRFADCNAKAAEQFGVSRERLIGTHPWEVSPDRQPDGRLSTEAAGERITSALAGRAQRFEWLHTNVGGDAFHAEISLSRVMIGDSWMVQALVRDVSERKRAEGLELALRSISEAAMAVASPDELYPLLHVAVAELMPARNLYICLYDVGSQTLRFPYYIDEKDSSDDLEAPQPLGRGLTEYVIRTGEPLLATGERFEELRAAGEVELVGAYSVDWLGTPLMISGKVIGVLAVQSYEEGVRYSESDLATLQLVSGHVANAIERSRAEAALRESEARYRDLVEGVSDLICTHDVEGNLLTVNPATLKMTGYEVDEVVGLNLRDFIVPEKRKLFGSYLQGIQQHGTATGLMQVVTKSGEKRFWEFSTTLRAAGVLKPVVRGVARDVTDRVTAERALREERDRARQVLDLAPVMFIGLDLDGRVTVANRRACEILGRPAKDVLGQTWFEDFVPAAGRDSLRAAFRQICSGDLAQFAFLEAPVLTATGEERMVAWHNTVVRDADDAIVGSLSSGEDVTERRMLEEHVRHAQKLEAMGQLAGGIAHDFNNLLQAMLSTVQLFRLGKHDPPAVLDTVGELENHVRRGGALAGQLLLFARRGATQPVRIDLNELVSEASGFLRRLLRENVRLITELAVLPLPVGADRGQLEQVLTNLALNAMDAMPDGGVLRLSTGRCDADQVWFQVADNGVGIDSAVRERIFEPFVTTKEVGKGTGLGLAVVHGIVARHQGRVEVSSDPGRGSTFRVTLPGADSGVFETVGARQRPGTSTPARGCGERVLVVEDDEEIRTVLARALGWLGYWVTTACSGEEAAALPLDPAYDLLLSDVLLPGLNGYETARALAERWPALKVVLMSGYAEDEVLHREITAGTVCFLQKPADLTTVAATIRAALDDR